MTENHVGYLAHPSEKNPAWREARRAYEAGEIDYQEYKRRMDAGR